MNIYLTKNGQQLGPYSLTQVQDMVKGGEVTLADFAWYEGLPDWVPLAQIPGIADSGAAATLSIFARQQEAQVPRKADSGVAAVEGPRQRPVLVWIICLFNFTCLPFGLLGMAITPALIASSKVALPEAQRHFYESQGLFNYYLPQFLNFALVLIWAIQLFRLKRNSIYFLLASIGVGVVVLIVDILTSDWLKVVGVIGLAGVAFAWALNGLLLYYNWHLIRTKVLR